MEYQNMEIMSIIFFLHITFIIQFVASFRCFLRPTSIYYLYAINNTQHYRPTHHSVSSVQMLLLVSFFEQGRE